MKNDIIEVVEACIDGTLDQIQLEFEENAAVCVVLASMGYPEAYEKGFEITGMEVFHEKEFIFPEATVDKEHYITCEQAIGDLPSLQTDDGEIIYGETIQNYEIPAQNEYQKKMRAHSKNIQNHIGSIPIEKTKYMISLVI